MQAVDDWRKGGVRSGSRRPMSGDGYLVVLGGHSTFPVRGLNGCTGERMEMRGAVDGPRILST